MLEWMVEQYFVNRVRKAGGRAYKLKFLSVAGAPDRLVFLPNGRMHLVELKRPKGGRLEPRQGRLHRLLAELGSPVILLHTKEQVDAWLLTLE